ncbi:transglutaminase-like cysteine peptidase, partial [Desulfobotulus sp. H1]
NGMAEEEARLRNRLRNAETELDTAIAAHDRAAMTKASVEHTRLYYELDMRIRRMDATRARLVSLQMELGRMTAASVTKDERILWCADYSDELEGRVGLAAIAGNPATVLIAPGGKDTDTHLLMTSTMPRHMAAWHQITEPAMEKWRPTFRTGTITDLDRETGLARIAVDDARSRLRPDISQNTEDVLEAVPVSYMACDHRVFREGDRVLIRWVEKRPVVVGFVENPRPCGERVWITFTDITGVQAFVSLCDRRISELQKDRSHADSCKNEFIPELLALYKAWEGRYFNYQYGIPWGKVHKEDVDRLSAPWIEWRDSLGGEQGGLGYDSYVVGVDRAIISWQNIRAIAQNAAAYLTLTVQGNHTPEEDVPDMPLSHAVWVMDGCSVDMNPTLLDVGNPSMKRQSDLAQAAADQWEEMGFLCAPVMTCSLRAGTSVSWQWQCRAGFLPDGETIIFSRDYRLSFPGFSESLPLEGCLVTVATDDGDLFRYPAPWPVHAAGVPTTGNETVDLSMGLRVSGALGEIFENFGAEVKPQDPDKPYVTGGLFLDDNPFTWMGYQAAGITHGMTGAGSATRQRVPAGFEVFAGRHPEHPIVTGKNDGREKHDSLNAEQKTADLRSVNDAVNTRYAYKEEAEGRDVWRFMTTADPWGDCEDFALTKIEMLLDRGWDIKDLQLQGGLRPAERWSATEGKMVTIWIGHMWVLAGGSIVLDNGGDLTTLAAMKAKGYQRIITQRGLVWTCEDTGREYTALPYPHYRFNEVAIQMTATVARWGGGA